MSNWTIRRCWTGLELFVLCSVADTFGKEEDYRRRNSKDDYQLRSFASSDGWTERRHDILR